MIKSSPYTLKTRFIIEGDVVLGILKNICEISAGSFFFLILDLMLSLLILGEILN